MKNTRCPSCGSGNLAPHMPGPPCVLRCEGCELIFLEVFPNADERRSYYQEEYYEEKTGGRFIGLFEEIVRRFRHGRMKDVLARLPARKSDKKDALLDVGCGRGVLLDCFRESGWDVTGTQLSDTARQACEKEFGVTVLDGELTDLGLESESYRAITFYHVLEHVSDPAAYLTEARRLLRADGLLLVEVPDGGAPGARWLGLRNFCFDYPNHLYFFERRGLGRLLEKSGFKVASVKRFSLEYSPFTCLQNLLNLLPGEPNRLFRALMRNSHGRRLRRESATHGHAALACVLALPAFLLSVVSMVLPFGNTLRFYCQAAEVTVDPALAEASAVSSSTPNESDVPIVVECETPVETSVNEQEERELETA
jgi:SAM-dependent methyltransferase